MKRSNPSHPRAALVVGGLALTAMGFSAGVASASPSRAESVTAYAVQFNAEGVKDTDVDAAPVILVANPDFRDPQWRGTVLLATPLPNGGHLGVIINRPTQLKLGQLFPEHAPSQKVLDPVYYGGPFVANTLFAVVRSGDASGGGSFALTPELVLATEAGTIDRIIEQAPVSARYYLGVVLWRPGELGAELEKELWSVHGASTETVFRKDTQQLWKELSVATRGTRVNAPQPTLVPARRSRALE